MFKQIKNFFTEDSGTNRRKAPRVDARGEASVIIDGKTYRLKNWSTQGILVGPYNGGLIAKQRSRVTIKLKDDKFNIDFDADVLVMRVDDEGLACRFFLLHPGQKKQIQEYLDYYKAG
jgi:hypothetical protein